MGNTEEEETIKIVVDAAEEEDIILQAIKEIDDLNVLNKLIPHVIVKIDKNHENLIMYYEKYSIIHSDL